MSGNCFPYEKPRRLCIQWTETSHFALGSVVVSMYLNAPSSLFVATILCSRLASSWAITPLQLTCLAGHLARASRCKPSYSCYCRPPLLLTLPYVPLCLVLTIVHAMLVRTNGTKNQRRERERTQEEAKGRENLFLAPLIEMVGWSWRSFHE